MSPIKTLLVIILFTCLGQTSFAQGIIKREALTSMDRGVEAMESGYYEAADQFFRDALSKMTKLPSNLAYYFGRNSYHLGKYKQAINWLNKYVELKGTTGQFNDEVREYLELANAAFKEQREAEIGRTQKQLTSQGYFDCPSDYMHCPLCNGTGVLITPGKFGAVYQTCPYSGLSGKLTCDEYNLYLRGELEKKVE
ncbi:tetratricopeptide repeat protein [Reichenbachiella sp.]|uniref:tetratricopeptide repeat protein n=1 Tax=Reichenbachiella sp. TaxID=2184521 RepID=UPI003BAFC76E